MSNPFSRTRSRLLLPNRRLADGFTSQQALLLLLICFPLGLIALGSGLLLWRQYLESPSQPLGQSAPSPQPPISVSPPSDPRPSQKPTLINPLPPSSPTPSTPTYGLSEAEARGVVEKWLTVKSQIFAPPFNTELADEVVASGPLWADLVKPDGSIDWLKQNDSYYTYSLIRVNRVYRYLPSSTTPSIVVSVTEESVLHSPKGSTPSSSTRDWVYTLKNEGGSWKIWDYRKQ